MRDLLPVQHTIAQTKMIQVAQEQTPASTSRQPANSHFSILSKTHTVCDTEKVLQKECAQLIRDNVRGS